MYFFLMPLDIIFQLNFSKIEASNCGAIELHVNIFAIRETQNFEYCCRWDAFWRSDINSRTEKLLKHNYI